MECEVDPDCRTDQICHNNKCINPCLVDNPCAVNAICEAQNHASRCICPPGLVGNPYENCESVECYVNRDCDTTKACIQNQCLDPCLLDNVCAPTAICRVINHDGSCTCPPGYIGDPMVLCTPKQEPIPELVVECEVDADCPSGRACINQKCVNPCYELNPCDATAVCSVVDTVPFRTMICSCREGWVPDSDRSCVPIQLDNPPGCVRDDECTSNEACINRVCKNPCDCGQGAECFLSGHRPVCRCPEGTIGNPQIACVDPGCQSDSECTDKETCVDGTCINPCLIDDPCGANAVCFPERHQANCRCNEGFEGDPFVGCIAIGCRTDADCPLDKACRNRDCVNPCQVANPCGTNADCLVSQHLAQCRCRFGYTGDPYVACLPFEPPECVQDKDCPTDEVCLEEKCINPCLTLNPCVAPATCKLVDTMPIRTMVCICPDGYVTDDNGGCRTLPPIKSGCEADDECPQVEACINAVCRDPCGCGLNARCDIVNHRPVCICEPGFYGDPEVACLALGCQSDSECKETHACRSGECTPVCGPDGLPCGGNADCTGIAHKPICTCPVGLDGDPYLTCSSKSCRANSDCPPDQACINKICQDPCAIQDPCDPSAECKVRGHQVDCTCPAGFEGSRAPGAACVKVEIGCRSDSDCPSQTACISGQCINPCSLAEPCGLNAICTVLDTLPVRTMTCVCIEGYEGDASIECTPVKTCPPGRGFILDENENCVCPPGYAFDENGNCVPCPKELGFIVDSQGKCVCDSSRGLILDILSGRCVCPPGYELNEQGICVESKLFSSSIDNCILLCCYG